MARLDKDRQNKLEPIRMEKAKEELKSLGYEIILETDTQLQIRHKGELVSFFPYSGWATGSSIKDGRGLQKLLNQLKK